MGGERCYGQHIEAPSEYLEVLENIFWKKCCLWQDLKYEQELVGGRVEEECRKAQAVAGAQFQKEEVSTGS